MLFPHQNCPVDLQKSNDLFHGTSMSSIMFLLTSAVTCQEHHRTVQDWPESIGILGDLGGILHLLDLDQHIWLLSSDAALAEVVFLT